MPVALRLLLVRHGLSSFNLERRIQGRNDLSTLTNDGVKQAIQTGDVLSDLSITTVYSSPLKRAKDTTINIIGQLKNKIDPIFDEELLEVDLGPWSGKTLDELIKTFPKAYQTWKTNPEDLILLKNDGSQYRPIKDLFDQTQAFLKKLFYQHSPDRNETILIVAHNAILRSIIILLMGHPQNGFRRLQLDNASISIFNVSTSKSNPYQVQIECLNSTTHLNPSLPKKKKSARVILVRHGETDWNLEGRFQGQIDIPLNNNGKTQALAAGSFLSGLNLTRAFSSSMKRPLQTAEAILQQHNGLKVELKEDLIEINHGLWEGKLESEIKEQWPESLKTWKNHPEQVQMPEGESIQQVWDRSINCWRKICEQLKVEDTALVVAHDAVNKTILCHLLGLSPKEIWMIKQGNGGITVIDTLGDPSQPDIVTCLNLTSHLGGVIDSTATGAL